jgi:hypothetical protein
MHDKVFMGKEQARKGKEQARKKRTKAPDMKRNHKKNKK